MTGAFPVKVPIDGVQLHGLVLLSLPCVTATSKNKSTELATPVRHPSHIGSGKPGYKSERNTASRDGDLRNISSPCIAPLHGDYIVGFLLQILNFTVSKIASYELALQ